MECLVSKYEYYKGWVIQLTLEGFITYPNVDSSRPKKSQVFPTIQEARSHVTERVRRNDWTF